MSTLQATTASNARILSSLKPPPNVVVVGGTAGIGRGIALSIKQHCPDANVTIIGRNESAANTILSQLGSNSKFIRTDASLMSEIRKATRKIDAVDMLILTQGILNMTGRLPTTENIDDKLSIVYYGRVLFVNELLPLLRSSPHDGKVLFVLNSKHAGNHAVAFTDLVIQHLAAQPENKNVTFTHAYPGSVKTEIGVNLPFYIRLPFKAFMAVRAGVTPEECAEYMVHGILGTENGWRCIDEKGETVRNKKESSTESAEKVWEHTSQIISRTN